MCSAEIEKVLEERGWLRRVAGGRDFEAAVAAIGAMSETGRGLIVSGEYGVGKSALAEIVARLCGGAFAVRLALPDEPERLTREWRECMSEDPFARNVWLDDLGAEATVNDFGVRSERAGDFIVAWHALHMPRRRLIVTTNLKTEEIDTRYGGRVLSRLKDLCVPLRLLGHDKRQWYRPGKGGRA